jgi:hypothetical protein
MHHNNWLSHYRRMNQMRCDGMAGGREGKWFGTEQYVTNTNNFQIHANFSLSKIPVRLYKDLQYWCSLKLVERPFLNERRNLSWMNLSEIICSDPVLLSLSASNHHTQSSWECRWCFFFRSRCQHFLAIARHHTTWVRESTIICLTTEWESFAFMASSICS